MATAVQMEYPAPTRNRLDVAVLRIVVYTLYILLLLKKRLDKCLLLWHPTMAINNKITNNFHYKNAAATSAVSQREPEGNMVPCVTYESFCGLFLLVGKPQNRIRR